MASIFLGQNRGTSDANPEIVTEGASTGATDVELRIDTGKNLTRSEVSMIAENLVNFLLDGRSAFFKM